MRDYEVTIENRKNTIWSNFLEPIRMVVSAENKKQAVDLAYEIFQPEYRMSREKLRLRQKNLMADKSRAGAFRPRRKDLS